MKKILSFVLVLVLLSLYPINNFLTVTQKNDEPKSETDTGVSVLANFASYDVREAEKNVNSYSDRRNLLYGGSQSDIKKTLKALDSGKITYRKVFRNVYIVGDSLMNGLEIYNILNSNKLITQVSANLTHLSDNMKKIVDMNPPVLILHYGINMIGTEKSHRTNFIANYSKLITELQDKLPDTRIIISGLFPVDRSIATAKRFKNVNSYNKALENMCDELGVEFLNSSSVLKAHPECYGIDGIHLSKNFYGKYWLRFIIKEMGIVA